MTTPIGNALQEIHLTIPRQILTYAFGSEDFREFRRKAPVAIDEMILSKVIRKRVLKDANLVGGKHVLISLEGLHGDPFDLYTRIYNIPPERCERREIISILNVSYLSSGTGIANGGAAYSVGNVTGQSDVTTAAQRIQDSFASMQHVSSASCELIGYNTVMLKDSMQQTQAATLRCVLANEENLSNLQPRSYRPFSKACILAAKAYVYNQSIIALGQGMIEQGQGLAQFKDIIDEYKESEEQYQDFLTNSLTKILMMNDPVAYERFISAQISPGL